MVITAECYERIVRLDLPDRTFGSGFTISRHDRQWLVTARHLVDGFDPDGIAITWHGSRVQADLQPVPVPDSRVDVAAFHLDHSITADLTLHPTSDGAVYSQDVYFLGYPYGLEPRAGSMSQPFVKKAVISASKADPWSRQLWYLDGISNRGFSGGPVVFNRNGTQDWHVMAVVSSHAAEVLAVEDGIGTVSVNTGIINAYDIGFAVDAIDTFMAR